MGIYCYWKKYAIVILGKYIGNCSTEVNGKQASVILHKFHGHNNELVDLYVSNKIQKTCADCKPVNLCFYKKRLALVKTTSRWVPYTWLKYILSILIVTIITN